MLAAAAPISWTQQIVVKAAPRIKAKLLNAGLYSRSDAARLLRVSSDRIGRWISPARAAVVKHTSSGTSGAPIVHAALPKIGNQGAVSFVELMELRVVKAFVDKGVSIQRVRSAASLAARKLHTRHPFALRRLYTDGRNIFSSLLTDSESSNLVRWTPDSIDQLISGPLVNDFLSEIEFDGLDGPAVRWWPLGKAGAVVLDPNIGFGAPVLRGTSIKTSAVARYVLASTVEEAARSFGVPVADVREARDFETALGRP